MTIGSFSAKRAFELEAGDGVSFIKMKDTERGTEFSFRIHASNTVHTIATAPTGSGRQAIENAAGQAGRWARVMADRVAA